MDNNVKHKQMKKLGLMVFTSLLLSISALAQDDKTRPLITVSGQAEVLVVPDEVVFSLNAVTRDKDLLVAKARNDEIVRKFL